MYNHFLFITWQVNSHKVPSFNFHLILPISKRNFGANKKVAESCHIRLGTMVLWSYQTNLHCLESSACLVYQDYFSCNLQTDRCSIKVMVEKMNLCLKFIVYCNIISAVNIIVLDSSLMTFVC